MWKQTDCDGVMLYVVQWLPWRYRSRLAPTLRHINLYLLLGQGEWLARLAGFAAIVSRLEDPRTEPNAGRSSSAVSALFGGVVALGSSL